MKLLNQIRKALALLMLSAFFALFLRFDSFGQISDFLTQIQLTPAIIAGSGATLLMIGLLTLLTGRIYCSLICPLGLIQDAFARMARLKKPESRKILPEFFKIHLGLAALMFGTAAAGFLPILVMADPFSLAGRIMSNVVQPVASRIMWISGHIFEGANWLNKARANPVLIESFAIAAILTLLLFLAVKKWGRVYCNLICPAGAILRVIAGFSVFHLKMDEKSCVNCGLCAKSCKAGCIDVKNHQIDFSRCVVCLNCVSSCNYRSIEFASKYFPATGTFSQQRRALLGGAATAAVAGIIPALRPNIQAPRMRILPPGSGNVKDFTSRCISCHLCISACPSSVIQASEPEVFSGSLAQPGLKFDRGMCEQTCNVCTCICPTGAIMPVTLEQKKTLKIAEVDYKKHLCVVETDGKDCGACAEHCPTKAVRMVPYKNDLMIPQVRPEICVGCGSCEHICPVRPQKAIIVNPVAAQTHIVLPDPEPVKDAGPIEEFPF